VLLLVLNSFWYDISSKGVFIDIGDCHSRVSVDFDVLAAIFVHIIQNTSKYILPNSQLRIRFMEESDYVNIEFDMVSLKIEDGESGSIWSEGYSGLAPRKLDKDGEGIGLFLVRKLVQLLDGEALVLRNLKPGLSTTRMGIEYEHNVFRISVPSV
jgi:signal transduction histidine kinase